MGVLFSQIIGSMKLRIVDIQYFKKFRIKKVFLDLVLEKPALSKAFATALKFITNKFALNYTKIGVTIKLPGIARDFNLEFLPVNSITGEIISNRFARFLAQSSSLIHTNSFTIVLTLFRPK